MKIIQQTNMTPTQMMGYTFVAKSGHVLVVDGGFAGDGGELKRIIKSVGGHADLWLLTHPHIDHYSAMIEAIRQPEGIVYDRLGAPFLTDEWAEGTVEGPSGEIQNWNAFASELDDRLFELKPGQRFELGSMTVEVLSGVNPDLTVNPINDQSCAFRVTEGDFSVLMLGDLGWDGGDRLLKSGCNLRADAVQMAHHGQNGVNEAFYRAVSPRYAFWPTPDWLWTNTGSDGVPGKGPFKTLEVRAWMDKLNTVNITAMEHTVVFDTDTCTVQTY